MLPSAQGGRMGRGQSAAKMCNDPVRCGATNVLHMLLLHGTLLGSALAFIDCR